MNLSGLMDDQLVAEIKGGSQAALEALVHRHYDGVYAYCARLLGNPTAAEDITQEVFLKLIKSIREYHARGLFRSWLMTIAVNACRSYLTSAPVRHGRDALDIETLTLEGDVNVQASVERRDEREFVLQCILSLPQVQREAVLLRFYGDCSLKEIAAITGSNLSTVKYRLRQANARLKKLLEVNEYGSTEEARAAGR